MNLNKTSTRTEQRHNQDEVLKTQKREYFEEKKSVSLRMKYRMR